MPASDGQNTREALRELVERLVEEKLRELVGDPDEDLEIRETVRLRLLKQKGSVASGERGRTLDEVMHQLDTPAS